MNSSGPGPSVKVGIGDLVDLAELISQDRDSSVSELRRRDRETGRRHEKLRDAPAAQLLAWLDRTAGDRRSLPGAAVDRSLRAGTAILLLAGLLLGWLASAAVFYYDGSHPVNIINVLAIFVGVQLVLVALLALSLLPGILLRSLPVVRTILETVDLLRPGRFLNFFAAKLPQDQRNRIQGIFDSGRRHGTLYGGVGKWSVTFASQVFATAFNVGALAGSLHLVFFTDLAFAWSTTLKVTSHGVHRVTSLLAWPWAAYLPGADPSAALVESSRYFRLNEGLLPAAAPGADPAVLGGWWPFLIMAMICYGLLPRILLLVLAATRLRTAVAGAFLRYPGVRNVLERMNGPLVDTRAREAEVTDSSLSLFPSAAASPLPAGDNRVCINWGEVPYSDEILVAALSPGGCHGGTLRAGGGNSLAEDRETVQRASTAGPAGVVIFARSWEPPMDDLVDFIAELRAGLDGTSPLTVLLAGPPAGDGMGPVAPEVMTVWKAKLAGLADPWVSVELLEARP